MSRNALLTQIEEEEMEKLPKRELPKFEIGDTVKVFSKIIEGNKERTQSLTGTVIAKKGVGISETFSIYRIAYGTAMERVYTLHSPRLEKIEVVRKGKVRRSKLYYIRGKHGKAAKIKERIVMKKKKPAKAKVVEPPKEEPTAE